MKALQVLKVTILSVAVLFSSCKKDNDDSPDQANSIKLLNTNAWNVQAKHSQKKYQGSLGGGFQSLSFDLQKQGELRWYLWFKNISSYSDATEIVLNSQNNVTISNPVTAIASDFRPIKTIYGADIWETHLSFNNASDINTFKNGQLTEIGYPYFGIKKLQSSEDGLLNNTDVWGGSNVASHFHYGTAQWKDNSFWATQYVSARYNNKTYVATFFSNPNTGLDGTITVYEESDTPGQGNIYPMTTKKDVVVPNGGYIMLSTLHGDNLFVAIDAHWQNKYVVYKINLNSYTVEKVMDETKLETVIGSIEIDPEGNFYVVRNRIENQTSYFIIRKYKSAGGNEIVLKEEDLRYNTQIHAIRYFNGKLHAAVVYREENPNDYTDNTYHFQIIREN